MKNLLFFIALVALCTALQAQTKVDRVPIQSFPYQIEQQSLGSGAYQESNAVPKPRTNPLPPSNQFYKVVGETYYNLPTNSNARNTIGFHSKSLKGATVWMMAQSFSSRGTGINYYSANTNSWGNAPNPETDRLENMRAGWGTHGFTEEGEVVVSHHNGTTGMIVLTRDKCGEGNWKQENLPGPQYKTNATTTVNTILWPSMATSGNTVHMICVTEQSTTPPYGYLGHNTVPLYYRSKDGGKTWDIKHYDFMNDGMTESEVENTVGDRYTITVRGNHVAFIYTYTYGYVCYMESKDGGDTWQRKVVYEFDDFILDEPGYIAPRVCPASSTIYIDENHKVHVAFSGNIIFRWADTQVGYINSYLTSRLGLIYWNEDHPQITLNDMRAYISTDGTYMYLDSLAFEKHYFGHIPCPSVVGHNEVYRWMGGPNWELTQFKRNGVAAYPRILAKDGRVYITFQSPLDAPFYYYSWEGESFYRGIFLTVSENYGNSWDAMNHTSWISYSPELVWADWSDYPGPQYDPEGNPVNNLYSISPYYLTENAYPSMSYNYKGDQFMLQWFNQTVPFYETADGMNYDPINVYTFTQDLKNFPAYKNVQEVYKGLWNGQEPNLEFPPETCEKPEEFSGFIEGKNIVLNWEEPEYIYKPLLGYNVFRNGEKLNGTPVIETTYTDENIANGTYNYQVSTVYDNCESKLTYGIKIEFFVPIYCEKPLDVEGTANENTAIITWKKPENIDGILVNYVIYRDRDSIAVKLPDELAFMDENLEDGEYLYQISAVYEHCKSDLTDGVKVIILGINDKKTNSFKIYPNPANGDLRIENGELKMETVEIYDIYGRNVLSHHFITSSYQHIINVSHLQVGVYLVKIYTERNQVSTMRFVILR